MWKRSIGIAMAVLLLSSILAGCGATKSESVASAPDMAVAPAATSVTMNFSESMDGNGGAKAGGAADIYGGSKQEAERSSVAEAPAEPGMAQQGAANSLAGTGNSLENVSNAILAERKIIRSANLTIEVGNWDEACNNINNIILGIGIVQESNISTEKYYVDDKVKLIKRGTIVLRVNKDKFDSVINNLKGIGEVYNEQINGQDVTDRFIDTESKLRLLKLEQGKLEAYLEKLNDLDKIFRTESRLTEIRQEIESLTGNLKKMSSLVELSTITLTMNEKYPDSDKKHKPDTYWQKLLDRLKGSLEGVVVFLGDLLIFLVAAIPVLIVLGLFVLLGVFVYRKIPKKKTTPILPQGTGTGVPTKGDDTGKDDRQ